MSLQPLYTRMMTSRHICVLFAVLVLLAFVPQGEAGCCERRRCWRYQRRCVLYSPWICRCIKGNDINEAPRPGTLEGLDVAEEQDA